MVENEVIGDLSSKKGGTMSCHDSELQNYKQKLNKFVNF